MGIANDNDRELQNNGSNTHFFTNVSQDLLLHKSIHEKGHRHRF